MTGARTAAALAGLALATAAPWLAPGFAAQLAFLWLMILFALTWDLMGGQMGYNSFGNVVFFGIGAYVCAVVQRDAGLSWYPGMFVGMAAGGLAGVTASVLAGPALLGLRGQYFAIGTLGLSVACGDLAAAWDYIGAGSGLAPPLYPGAMADRQRFFCTLLLVLAVLALLTLHRLHGSRLGLTINAIRDDEDKAESMGLPTVRCKVAAWAVAALFLGLAGGPVGNLVGFIDPRDLAFAGSTYGVWMVLMAVLGGKGTLWGPVIGAVIFHVTQEVFWTWLLGWQRVALGVLIVVIVVFFPRGVMGWLRQRRPERFGAVATARAPERQA